MEAAQAQTQTSTELRRDPRVESKFRGLNVTLKNTQNGVRIKSWPSTPHATTVTDMRFEDITMAPSKVKISNVSFKNINGTSATKEGVILICSKSIPCEGVELNEIKLTEFRQLQCALMSNLKL
ncbi:hypothetical protein Lal_00030820 [Lupinus albus]|nr:hypothetical protein Lal_00030820 [Lupinus albus]